MPGWDWTRKQTLESIASRAGYPASGELPAVSAPFADASAGSFATVGLWLLDQMISRTLVPVGRETHSQVLAAMFNLSDAERAEAASDFLVRCLLHGGRAISAADPELTDEAPIEDSLLAVLDCHRPVSDDLSERLAMFADALEDDQPEGAQRVVERAYIDAGRHAVEIALDRRLPDAASDFTDGGYGIAQSVAVIEYDEMWSEAHDQLNAVVAEIARRGSELQVGLEEGDPEDSSDHHESGLDWRAQRERVGEAGRRAVSVARDRIRRWRGR